MSFVNSRASGLWEAITTMNHNEGDVERQDSGSHCDGRTPLDKTIDRIGMGSYQWTLLSLCGFGWLADNMWLQAIAIILPRMQQHFSIPDTYAGVVSSSMFAGMMVGAVGWGTCSDFVGRSAAFNGTLFFTAIFGLLASFSNSYTMLCITLFLLGSSVGGSMPTDGTLILETVPKENQHLITALSMFFSLGSVLAAVVALFILPGNSCPIDLKTCDVDIQNRGWKSLLACLAVITFAMFLARIVFFRLYESPRYLVHAGRPHEAIRSLQMISRFNGSELSIELADVRDHHCSSDLRNAGESGSPIHARLSSATIFDASVIEDRPPILSDTTRSDRSDLITVYDSISKTDGISIQTAEPERMIKDDSLEEAIIQQPLLGEGRVGRRRGPSTPASRRSSLRSSLYDEDLCRLLPKWMRNGLENWTSRVMMILSPEWLRTTVLVWSSWCAMALAYTMFNVYFPKLLELREIKVNSKSQTLEKNLWEVVLFTLGGCPGAFVGAYITKTRLGRKWSLAGSSFMTALSCITFAGVTSTWAIMFSSVGFNLWATVMWAILYSWTPDIFETKVRGTACGIASALSRIGGMLAPILGGILLMINHSIPVYTSAVVFVVAGICVSSLGERDQGYSRRKLGQTIIH